jgi:hypothetical protein
MNRSFLLPPSQYLNSPHVSDTGNGGGASSNSLSRRSFIKRTGGATVATIVATTLAAQQAEAGLWDWLKSLFASGSPGSKCGAFAHNWEVTSASEDVFGNIEGVKTCSRCGTSKPFFVPKPPR